jgi:membrane dipeptidase
MHRGSAQPSSRFLLQLLLTVPVLLSGCNTPSEESIQTHAREVHARAITIDTHVDIPGNFATPEVDPGARGQRKVDLVKMREGGLDVVFWAVYVGQRERTPEGYAAAKEQALNEFAAIRRVPEMHPDQIELAYTPADVVRIHAAGKLVECIGIENGYVIGQDLGLVQEYYDLGARYITLTHNGHNDICDSANPNARLGDEETEHGGVSAFGEQVIAEMNRLGVMVDVSHTSKACMMDAARLSRAPIIASHSSARALADVSRNMDDEQLLALKANGGVIQIVAVGEFVKSDPPEKIAAVAALREEMGFTGYEGRRSLTEEQRAEYRQRMAELDERWPGPTLQDLVDHVDYVVRLIGVDHVGLGSDFDGGGGVVGWNDASESLNVTTELVRRGYSDDEIVKIWGGNLLRVWREVERVAADVKAGG